jgi:hypothetical protein
MAEEEEANTGEFDRWVQEGVRGLEQAVDAYLAAEASAPGSGWPALREAFTAEFSKHYERLGPRLRRNATEEDRVFVMRTRLYGTQLREPALALVQRALREVEGRPQTDEFHAWVLDDVYAAATETELLDRELARSDPETAAGAMRRPRAGKVRDWVAGRIGVRATRAGSQPGGGGGGASQASAPQDVNGWVRIDDDVHAYGRDWWKVLDWPAPISGTASSSTPQVSLPGSGLLNGLYGLYVRKDETIGRVDGTGSPVLLASGVWVTQHGRDALNQAIEGDVACRVNAEDPLAEVQCAKESRVMQSFGHPICDYYDGRGNVFLAECDCLKQLSLPSMVRLNRACKEADERGVQTEADRLECDRMLQRSSSSPASPAERDSGELGKWPVQNINNIRDRVFRNLLYRYAVRSARRMEGMQGTFAACVYGPCDSENSRTAYTDALVTQMELSRCPGIRCNQSINLEWNEGNVFVEGNMLVTRCTGQLCLDVNGEAKCKNNGRCLQDGKCDCSGTGYRGDFCQDKIPEDDDDNGGGGGGGATPPEEPDTPAPAPAKGPGETPWAQQALNDVAKRALDKKLIMTGVGVGAGVLVAIFLLRAVRRVRQPRQVAE